MIYNTHIHIFKTEDIPVKFLPLKLVRFFASKSGSFFASKILNNINPFSNKDIFDRYKKFMSIGNLDSQEAIFDECQKFYPPDTKFVVLPMDMAFMEAGKVIRPYENQIEELAKLAQKNEKILPFLHIDPRRKGIFDFLKKCVEDWNFKGIKLYPPLGYFPYDKRLYPIYEYCENNNLPVISHCSPYNSVHFRGKKENLFKLLSEAKIKIETEGKNNKELCYYFAHPKNYEYVLKDFMKLKINLAHFGSDYFWDRFLDSPKEKENWFSIIRNMIVEYENLYTDTSFTLNNQNYFSLFKVLLANQKIRDKILFGSDYYMVETQTNERRFSLDLRAFIGENNFNIIARKNPKRFLGIK
ncbi:MAG: amidohydrolase family protein [Bacteroidetes bacterium]|nr:amidohydrolase family protein [Bacteroidota bacterium]MBT6686546.1 amidohydrolase family protein [Bacteroidota bacterium]MBT7142909.1 amidohydrolase family protein [Bacteroidota bacterium]MBT7490642.1 amidohydrolase family protein [Bacteroidota bacterium]